jgi:hypothetical protein
MFARMVCVLALLAGSAQAGERGGRAARAGRKAAPVPDRSGAIEIDRVVVRWSSPATGGPAKPQFILARELAFEARIEAMAEGLGPAQPFADKHVRAALQRHMTESMLAQLPVEPRPTPKQVAAYAEAARLIVEQRVGGRERLHQAAVTEGMVADELNALLRRQARASWYLDRMVAPMLEPTESDLREVHKSGETPYTEQPFDQIAPQLRRWLVATRLSSALIRYFRNAQGRINLRLIGLRRGRRSRAD